MAETMVGGRRSGKRAAVQRIVEKELDKGRTIIVVSRDGYEVRGAGVAKDVTPTRLALPDPKTPLTSDASDKG
jgi:hypothetical protein